jgi:hypothetical protein
LFSFRPFPVFFFICFLSRAPVCTRVHGACACVRANAVARVFLFFFFPTLPPARTENETMERWASLVVVGCGAGGRGRVGALAKRAFGTHCASGAMGWVGRKVGGWCGEDGVGDGGYVRNGRSGCVVSATPYNKTPKTTHERAVPKPGLLHTRAVPSPSPSSPCLCEKRFVEI